MENGTQNARNGQNNNFFTRLRSIFPQDRTTLGEKKPWYKLPLARRIIYFVLSLLLAVFLWGFVLMTQNPDREKTFYDLKPTFESGTEADLILRKLTICGDLNEILKDVDVTVSAPLTEVSKMTANNLTVTVNLNDVHEAGRYTLEIKAVSTVGTVKRVEPSTIEIEVDDLVSNTIPVSYDFVNADKFPEGYWHDTPTLLSTTTIVEGAKRDISKVRNAVCHIDLENCTDSIYGAYNLSVLDYDNNEMDAAVFKNSIPTVTVRMTVLPHRQIPVVVPQIIDDELATDIFEIVETTLPIDYLDIAAEKTALDALTEITCEPIRLTGITEPGTYTFLVKMNDIPENSYVLRGVTPNTIQCTVVIAEREIEQRFVGIPVTFIGENDGYNYIYDLHYVDIIISGPARLVRNFASSELTIIVNVKGRTAGEYDIELEYTLEDYELYAELNIKFVRPTVHVTVTPRESL
ncbi:MAG: hypothetical protein K6F68_08970 [Clostridiales bacterium]|nr:hypothetical protein [Clostridiales bacterium]